MLVKDVMQTAVLTAPPDLPLPKVLRLLQGRGFRHVPVVDGDVLVGIISDRDVKQAMASAAASAEGRERDQLVDRLTAAQIMTRSVQTIGPTAAIEDAVKLMVSERISAVPVTEGGRLQGIVTETDVLNLFARATGVLEPSSRVDVLIPDDSAEGLGGVVRAVEETGARISSIMTLAMPTGEREVVVRIATINPGPVVKASWPGATWRGMGDRGAPGCPERTLPAAYGIRRAARARRARSRNQQEERAEDSAEGPKRRPGQIAAREVDRRRPGGVGRQHPHEADRVAEQQGEGPGRQVGHGHARGEEGRQQRGGVGGQAREHVVGDEEHRDEQHQPGGGRHR